MKKNDDRKLAEQMFLDENGRVTNKDLAERLDVHPATIARWRRIDEWDLALVDQMRTDDRSELPADDMYFNRDLKHLDELDERIDTYLQRKELLPQEILHLAQAKFAIMSCREITGEQGRYPPSIFDMVDDEDFD